MRFYNLPGAAGARLSELGFGCSALLGRASVKESERAVSAALDAGITFFDVARSYGYGEAEGLLGRMVRERRDQVVICTKFGIFPSSGGWKRRMRPLARTAVKLFPSLRKAAQRQAASEFTKGQFSVAALHNSLETSLRKLRTDYVDILLMHAAPRSVLEQGDLLQALERLVVSGKVRAAGISGQHDVISAYFAKPPSMLKTAQFAMDADSMSFVERTVLQRNLLLVANHPFGGTSSNVGERIEALRNDAQLPKSLREKLNVDDPQVLPELILHCILSQTGVSAVVPAMMQVKHIESNVRAIDECRFSMEELKLLRIALAGLKIIAGRASNGLRGA